MIGNTSNLKGIVVVKIARMQQIYGRACTIFARPKSLLAFAMPLLFAAGCVERPTTIDPVPALPHAGVVLKVAVSDPVDRELVRQLGRSWATRSGGRIEVLETPWDGTADVGLVAPSEMPRWAATGKLAEVPTRITRVVNHPYRWDDVLRDYKDRLIDWGGTTCALPVTGEGMVLAYRKEAFDGKDGRPNAPPATWDGLLDAARTLGQQFGKCLPPVPAGRGRLAAEFFAAAACYDRPAVGRLTGEVPREDFFAFQFDPARGAKGEPRLTAPAFIHVATLFHDMAPLRVDDASPADALRSGRAKLGVISLAELGQVGPEAAAALGVAPLPGATFTFGPKGERKETGQGAINRVPYLGWGGRVGVVAATSANQAAAWDFLADAGMPEGTALDLLAAPRWGAGPYRTSQLETGAQPRWYAYGLSEAESERLVSALRDNLGQGVQNYRLHLRTPNQHEIAPALDAELRAVATGTRKPDEAMRAANDRWRKVIENLPGDQWEEAARKSLGLRP
jgi:multiple sugar transport system substrate-binding protein